jgi:ubiquitin carboxyl-terminal hydrolase 9/24
MTDTIRQGILSAPYTPCDDDWRDCDDGAAAAVAAAGAAPIAYALSTPEGKRAYALDILHSMQVMFANLLGSQLQYFVPRRFWKQFR